MKSTRRGEPIQSLICGHIHRPEINSRHGVLYCNDGDWVEDLNGELELWNWADQLRSAAAGRQAIPLARAA